MSLIAAAVMAAAVQASSTNSPASAEGWTPLGWPQKDSPAFDGRYGETLLANFPRDRVQAVVLAYESGLITLSDDPSQ